MKGNLVYFADPMCSWCWGFSPVIQAVRARFEDRLGFRLFLGGLAPGTTAPLDDGTKQQIREHWEHVRALAGQPFDFGFFDRTDFVYDTEPACRAVVAARQLDPAKGIDFLARLHRAFYQENQDITDPRALRGIAKAFGLPADEFSTLFDAEQTRQETQTDFAFARRVGITGYPALLAITEGSYSIITLGYQPFDKIEALITGWLEGLQKAQASRG